MPVKVLGPGEGRVVTNAVPRSREVEIHVSASGKVDTAVVDDVGLERVRAGRDPGAHEYGGFKGKVVHRQVLRLPGAFARWHLVVVNTSKRPVSVYYEALY